MQASAREAVYDLQDNFDSDNGPVNDNTNNEGPSIIALSPIVEVKQCGKHILPQYYTNESFI